ncbi:hypothetical protein CONPUDRAFT_134541 [Coniophora puteana RWD-64-598 SS2]|uniref:Splicing arginine serine-rich 12 n=1 Tax=Coniophora puteana (strain RWD-64-598) TaxID=741705 RepID=A0A5M3N7B0_CONPW|nr:uncharacterized protein CONPUDRAFT_134541 [Coniophora puteana RWD-64-598 SS2]EIW87332.1 hypothetical protein CONPUDRAFT_134541 [Coniophora puteana RWD-64-598 SS2]
MPSGRDRYRDLSRSRSPARDHDQDRSRDSRSRRKRDSRSRSPDTTRLPPGVDPISESDYFLKNTEFRAWLKDEKDRYFDELSGEKARSYFRKFVKAWNKGKLPDSLYDGSTTDAPFSANQTASKWSFTSKTSSADASALRAIHDEVNTATHGSRSSRTGAFGSASAAGSGRRQGPTLPSAEDAILAREAAVEDAAAERDYKRKRDKKAAKDRVEDAIGPKEVGREGMLEKKRAQRDNDRAFREKGDEGLELDEGTLMGGGDSFRDQIARRDAARKRFEDKKVGDRAVAGERSEALRQKEKATMDMFQQLAKQRFG